MSGSLVDVCGAKWVEMSEGYRPMKAERKVMAVAGRLRM